MKYLNIILYGLLGCVINYFAFVEDYLFIQIICYVFTALGMLGLCGGVHELEDIFEAQNIWTFLLTLPFTIFGYWCYFYHGHMFYGGIMVIFHTVLYSMEVSYKILNK